MKKTLLLLCGLIAASFLSCLPVEEKTLEWSDYQPIYELVPTTNIWTFLKLDTREGKIWQVQFDIEGDNRIEAPLNIQSLIPEQEQAIENRFSLYPTKNIYTFILLDRFDGRLWQIQWSWDPEHRLILPMN